MREDSGGSLRDQADLGLQECVRRRIAEISTRLKQGGYASADDYYADKDLLRFFVAKSVGKTVLEHDPMGFWFGRQS